MASAWIEQVFSAASAKNGNVVRRKTQSVETAASVQELIQEARNKGFHVIEFGDQIVVLCADDPIRIHC